jgi:hypothetical protein
MGLPDRLIFQPVLRPFGEPEHDTNRVPLERNTSGTECRVDSVQTEHEADRVPCFRNIGGIAFRSGYEKSEHGVYRVLPSIEGWTDDLTGYA